MKISIRLYNKKTKTITLFESEKVSKELALKLFKQQLKLYWEK